MLIRQTGELKFFSWHTLPNDWRNSVGSWAAQQWYSATECQGQWKLFATHHSTAEPDRADNWWPGAHPVFAAPCAVLPPSGNIFGLLLLLTMNLIALLLPTVAVWPGLPQLPLVLLVQTIYFCDIGHLTSSFCWVSWCWPSVGWTGLSYTKQCCRFNFPPWFYKQLPQPTNDDIEMRCRDDVPWEKTVECSFLPKGDPMCLAT